MRHANADGQCFCRFAVKAFARRVTSAIAVSPGSCRGPVPRLLRLRGVELVEINVDGEDRDARRFYERHGFSCVHDDEAEPELYYNRELS